ncbi:hypothetical protein AU381_10760 [Sinorhizobium glycinis]|uniref:Methyltransferase n=1 Tax=Sinorhizobium glycinis TaxID=1472378 RepID=A0A178XXQ5_9HYPH|nr:class I SAM-dependent methyltransferase [Sinorhizobium glycinis]OAP40011.1 hypothetical protein AU381_10760 [Sinorhizobium glycinis]
MNIPIRKLLRPIKRSQAARILALPYRAYVGGRYIAPVLGNYLHWLARSREHTNFTYELTADNLLYLAHTLSFVTAAPLADVKRILLELEEDAELRNSIADTIRKSAYRGVCDANIFYGRRAAWYAVVRLMKPRIVVETGVDKGLGSIILCAALRRNKASGSPGHYYGTDINPEAGWLLTPPYSEHGDILIGDSIETLKTFSETIDVFINDSDHSSSYEKLEYETISNKINEHSIIIGDNSGETDELAKFAESTERLFLLFKENPKNHWFGGGGAGFCFSSRASN